MPSIRLPIVDLGPRGRLRVVWGLSQSGRYHGQEFFSDDCSEDQRSKFMAVFQIVADQGFLKNEKLYKYPLPYCGNMGEFKTHKKRLFFYRAENDLVVTHGATKKKDETDKADIERVARLKGEIEAQERAEKQKQGASRQADGGGQR